jgi:hypothetical protein
MVGLKHQSAEGLCNEWPIVPWSLGRDFRIVARNLSHFQASSRNSRRPTMSISGADDPQGQANL